MCPHEPGYFRCKGRANKCIPPEWLCDGVKDCDFGDDESDVNCKFESYTCLSGVNRTALHGHYWPVAVATYGPFGGARSQIPSHWRCDGEQDCAKGKSGRN